MIEYSYTQGVATHSNLMKESERQQYVDKVYRFLMKLKPGTKILVDAWCKAETRPLFIEVVKMYIDEGGQVEFIGDYEGIKKIQSWTE
jgi:hypothetical protein